METTAQQRALKNLTFWQQQASRLEQDRKNLKWIAIGGIPAAVVGFLFKPIVGAGMLATVITAGVMGLYLTTVRRGEYSTHVREAEEAVRETKPPS
jgi:undecaprenyl pyrophosphate phosphatase UppP